MTTTQILDKLAPYTAKDRRCGFEKKKKIEIRYRWMLEIEKMQKDGLRNDDILLFIQKQHEDL